MNKKQHTAKELINKKGGRYQVSQDLGFQVQRINHWQRRGIPLEVLIKNNKYFNVGLDDLERLV